MTHIELVKEIVGYAAAVFGTSILLPQVYKSYTTRRVDDISMTMLVVYIINCTLWEVYGLLLHALPMILCNAFALVVVFVQVYLKKKYQTASGKGVQG